MKNKNHKFCVLFATRNYYDMFEGCLYKYSKANWNDVVVLNVDINSNPDDKERGKRLCSELGIHFVNPDVNYTSCQQSVTAADEYLLKENIDVDWILQFQHDVVPAVSDFWKRLDDNLSYIDDYKDKVSMFGANVYQYIPYDEALRLTTDDDLVKRHKTGTATGRGCLEGGMLDNRCWYRNLPDEYYLQKYFVVESPMWTCGGFNRKLFRENIIPDEKMKFELWPDDIAHQFLKKNFINVSFPDLLTIHDHDLKPKSCVSISRGNVLEKDFDQEQLRFIEKHGWRWGYRQYDGPYFKDVRDDYWDTMQEKIYSNSISDGPKLIDDYLEFSSYGVAMSDIVYSFEDVKNILLTDTEVKGDFVFDDTFFDNINKIYDGQFNYNLTDMSCAVVGNSPNLIDSNYGELIDSYDIVIRCNHSPVDGYEIDVGSKTDFRILSSKVFGYDEITSLSNFDHNYLSSLINQHFIIKMPLDRFPHHALFGFEKNFGSNNKVTVIKNTFQKEISENLNFVEPSTGLFAVILFLSFVENVHMFGFDFYKDISKTHNLHYFEKVSHIPSHDFSQEHNIVKELCKTGRVKLFQ